MKRARPVYLFTDFGWSGPYVGQMVGALLAFDPAIPVVSLMHDAPRLRPDLAAYLLPACCRVLPDDAIVVAVVDPGVGGERAGLVVETATRTYVGPDNGLLSRLPQIRRVLRILWRPQALSTSFHGRDLFAPVAARLALGVQVACADAAPAGMVGADWADDLFQVIYVDGFGNLITGVDAENINYNREIVLDGRRIRHARTFCDVAPGSPFWYPNSLRLLEIAVNGGSAASQLSLAPGDRILLD